MDEHPSGRPLPRERYVSIERNAPRIPREEFLTPRLRTPQRDIAAIGFPLDGPYDAGEEECTRPPASKRRSSAG